MTLRAELWQHPVGQGGFHSGFIEVPTHPLFRYVYDCGRYRTKATVWDRFLAPAVRRYGSRKLDALFISHFDDDHINGLPRLLRRFAGARITFLPYLHPVVRLMMAVRESERTGDLSEDYRAFIGDPAGWLRAHDVDEVIYVSGPDPDDPETGGGGPRVPDVPMIGETVDRPFDRPLDLAFQRMPLPLPEADMAEGERTRLSLDSTVGFLDCRDPIVLSLPGKTGMQWIFQTYVDPDKTKRDSVHSFVRDAFPDLYEALCRGTTDCAEVLADKARLLALKSAYRDALARPGLFGAIALLLPGGRRKAADPSQMNRSSMSLFSGPLWRSHNPDPEPPAWHSNMLFQDRHIAVHESAGRCGWLLTGDAVLSDAGVLDRFVRFFGYRQPPFGECFLGHTLVFAAPHHGSKRNFGAEEYWRVGLPPFVVIPAADGKYFNHPNDEVIDALRSLSGEILHVHEATFPGVLHDIEFY